MWHHTSYKAAFCIFVILASSGLLMVFSCSVCSSFFLTFEVSICTALCMSNVRFSTGLECVRGA